MPDTFKQKNHYVLHHIFYRQHLFTCLSDTSSIGVATLSLIGSDNYPPHHLRKRRLKIYNSHQIFQVKNIFDGFQFIVEHQQEKKIAILKIFYRKIAPRMYNAIFKMYFQKEIFLLKNFHYDNNNELAFKKICLAQLCLSNIISFYYFYYFKPRCL